MPGSQTDWRLFVKANMSYAEEAADEKVTTPIKIAPADPHKAKDEKPAHEKRHHYSVKRYHTRTYQTLLTGSKVRHLKKKDGEPLWREDIQYDFLYYIFTDEHAVFTNRYNGTPGHTFATLYIDAMARSSKCSKVLADKLLGDRRMALNIAMVCLLVNIGRVNTTLNFFPEMKAQLRTYHPIPSLQAGGNSSDYKQLQDAPRLKSILKGACEDQPEPGTLEDMATNGDKPHTNPINLVFLMSTYSPKVRERFMTDPYDLFDLIMNKHLSSRSRGRVFLWLLWAYLETDLSKEQLQSNPFGMGEQEGTKVPAFETALENVDTPEEKEFGDQMRQLRLYYIDESGQQAKRKLSELPQASRSLRHRASVDYTETPDGAEDSASKSKTVKKLKSGADANNGHVDKSRVKRNRKSTKGGSRVSASYDPKFVQREWARIRAKGRILYDSETEGVPKNRKLSKNSEKTFEQHEYEMGIARAQRRSLRWLSKWKIPTKHDDLSVMIE
jgi:Ino eighty subunit 1